MRTRSYVLYSESYYSAIVLHLWRINFLRAHISFGKGLAYLLSAAIGASLTIGMRRCPE